MERLLRIQGKQDRLVAGLMSGTSVDGIDVAIMHISGNGLSTKVKLEAFATIPYIASVRERILAACNRETADLEEVCRLNFLLGELFAEALLKVSDETGISVGSLDLIGSHGHTVYHIPGNSTLQIGEPAVIAERTGVITIADFRVRDVAAGGQGAPLVPYSEFLLYRHPEKTRLLQNIGGIANVTVLPAGCRAEEVTAFDTGPGNMLIDACASVATGGREWFDRDGKLAAKGNVNEILLAELQAHPYITAVPPKTTGRELFGRQLSADIIAKYSQVPINDIIATVTYFTAWSIAENYRRFILPKHQVDEVYISGGGARNYTLMTMLRQELNGVAVFNFDRLGLASDAKEAVAFGVLANETINGCTNNLPSVTMANRPVVMGKISL